MTRAASAGTETRTPASAGPRTLEAVIRGSHPSGHSRRRRDSLADLLADAPRGPLPRVVRPMLATLVDAPFDRPGWIFEPKWDGYRAVATVHKGSVRLVSRNQKPFEAKYAPVARALESLGHDAVLDGEIVVVDAAGRSHFQLLQNYQRTGAGNLLYYVFDIVHLDGHDLHRLPLLQRKEILARLIAGDRGVIRLSEHVEKSGIALFAAAQQHGLEGIIAKSGQSVYAEGARGHDWLKIKTKLRQEAVIGGFTEPRGGRKHLGALILGVYDDDGKLVYIGHSGGGFTTSELAAMRARLEPLERTRCPFSDPPRTNAPVHWVAPRVVCEVAFQEWTADGMARHPIYVGLREDKPARDVRRELPRPLRTTGARRRRTVE